MRSALVYLLAFAILALCAQTSPIPPPSHFSSSRDRIPRSDHTSPSSLRKRTPGGATELIEDAEAAIVKAAKAKKGAWKKPVILTSAAIGVVMTVGWNYIAFKSFFSNRAKHLKEQRRQEAEKLKPPPKVGDIMCLVETYTTQDQVDERKPGVLRAPCYKLVDPPARASSNGVSAAPATSPATTPAPAVQAQSAVQRPDLQASPFINTPPTSDSTAAAPVSEPAQPVAPSPDPQTSAYVGGGSSSALAGEGRLNKRGETSAATVSEIVEDVIPKVQSVFPPSSVSSSSASSPHELVDHQWIPSSHLKGPFSREMLYPDEERRRLIASSSSSPSPPLLSSAMRQRAGSKLPGFPALRPLPLAERMDPVETMASFEIEEEDKAEKAAAAAAKQKGRGILVPFNALKKVKDLDAEDIAFGLTILNTIGGIPSLILTTINAYLYRGNPKVD